MAENTVGQGLENGMPSVVVEEIDKAEQKQPGRG